MREDLLDASDDLDWITAQLAHHDDRRIQLLSRLTTLRQLDIIAWMIADD